jgi:VanZ family protein
MILWAPVIAWMAAIFIASSVPDVGSGLGGVSDKAVHLGVYAVLGLVLARALSRARWRQITMRTVFASVVLSVLYGLTDEWHQTFVPGRSAELADLAADAVGAAAGGIAAWAWGIISPFSHPRGEPDGVHEPPSRA